MEPGLIRSRHPRSRGRVRCSLCLTRIPRGMTYTRDTLVYDNMIYDWPQCPSCDPVVYAIQADDCFAYDLITHDSAVAWALDTMHDPPSTERMLASAFLERCGFQTDAEGDAKSWARKDPD